MLIIVPLQRKKNLWSGFAMNVHLNTSQNPMWITIKLKPLLGRCLYKTPQKNTGQNTTDPNNCTIKVELLIIVWSPPQKMGPIYLDLLKMLGKSSKQTTSRLPLVQSVEKSQNGKSKS